LLRKRVDYESYKYQNTVAIGRGRVLTTEPKIRGFKPGRLFRANSVDFLSGLDPETSAGPPLHSAIFCLFFLILTLEIKYFPEKPVLQHN
jgi:hypothetical protein